MAKQKLFRHPFVDLLFQNFETKCRRHRLCAKPNVHGEREHWQLDRIFELTADQVHADIGITIDIFQFCAPYSVYVPLLSRGGCEAEMESSARDRAKERERERLRDGESVGEYDGIDRRLVPI